MIETPARAASPATAFYRTVWRWHFYAGLFVMPFIILLTLSGTVYLFKPQIERWEERAYAGSTTGPGIAASAQVATALAAFPGTQFHSYRIPERVSSAALVHLSMPDGGMRDVFIAADGTVLGSLNANSRITEVARRLHGQLLLGSRSSKVVELVACWAIVMVITGLCLWWPRGRGPAGVLWPRRKTMLRDLHAVTGFWVSALALVLLLTGLPWTDVWGNAFRMLRAELGWVSGPPQWETGSPSARPEHVTHDHSSMHAGHVASFELQRIDAVVARASAESVAPPALVIAPGVVRFGVASPHWLLTSGTQNRPLGMTVSFDAATGSESGRETFAQQHPIDRAIGYGLAWHEGALLGALNQLIGMLTALALVAMSITGFLLWRRRRPAGRLGAPALPAHRGRPVLLATIIVLLALLLPLFAVSLVALLILEALVRRISPASATWLGIGPARERAP